MTCGGCAASVKRILESQVSSVFQYCRHFIFPLGLDNQARPVDKVLGVMTMYLMLSIS